MSEIIGTVCPSTFEWIIPSLQHMFLQQKYIWIWSPDFHQRDFRWRLNLRFDISEECIYVYLGRKDNGALRRITCTIKVKGRTDVAEITKTALIDAFGWTKIGQMFLKKGIGLNSIVQDSFTIICHITWDTLHPVAEREWVTCASQTEVPDCMSCAIQTEDEDWLSLDRKGVALLSERMKDLLNKSSDTDVTICVQGKEFRAHRTILRTRSPVFAMMLAHDTKENNTGNINIEDCDPEFFNEFLLFVYSGRTENLTPSSALQLYYTADKYDFPVLKELCLSLLKTSLSVESICDVVHLAAKHQEKELLEVATEFFTRNVKKILVTVAWQNFMSENPVEANELYIKSMNILLPEN